MGATREHEVRITGLALAVVATLVAAVAIWAVVSAGTKLRSQVSDASVPQASLSR
jgi:hypothetical protein